MFIGKRLYLFFTCVKSNVSCPVSTIYFIGGKDMSFLLE